MLKVFGENYYVDFDEIEKYVDMSEGDIEADLSGNTEMRINIIKYEMVKMMLEVLVSEETEIDDKLGLKSNANNISVPFKLAFNSLLNKKIINHY